MAKWTSHREWSRADDDTDSFPVLTGELAGNDGPGDDDAPVREEHSQARSPAWVRRFGEAVVARLPRLSAAIAGGLLLCLSFPPFGWWYTAIVAFALLAWVLTRDSTTLVGGFGYGFLFGAAFNIPLLPWTSVMVGLMPWLALAIAQAVFPGLFGLLAVAVARRLTGWPIWFARPVGVGGVGQVDGAVRRIPLGCSRFRSNRWPAAAAGAGRRGAAGVVRGDAARIQPRRAGVRDRRLVAAR